MSIIGVLRDLETIEQLDASTRSTLQHNIIHLEKYPKAQLVDILNDRVAMAFDPSTVAEDVVDIIADLAVSESGNARFAIELLWRAGKYADAADNDLVEPECVRKAISSITPILRRSELNSLRLHEKLLLLGVARLFKENSSAYASLSEIEKVYAVVCEEFDEQPLSHIQLWKYVQFLSAMGIIKAEVVGEGIRGRSTRISLSSVSANDLEKKLVAVVEESER
jgi:cell division control protein 6